MTKKGFTLTEILIVVAILGIMASLAIPSLFPQTERARASEAVSILSAIRQGEEAYRLSRGSYLEIADVGTTAAENQLWAQLGLENPNTGTRFFDYVVTTPSANTFVAFAIRNNTPVADYNGQVFGLTNTGQFCQSDYAFTPEPNIACP